MRFCGGLFLIGGLCLLAFSAAAQTNEFRGLWADAFSAGFKTSSEVTTLVNNARAGNLNAIIPQIRKRGDAYYNGSIYEPKATDVTAGFDPLLDLITKAHDTSGGKQRVEVHTWIATYPISTSASPGANHPMTLHPDWLSQTDGGTTYDGKNYWFDQAHPGVQEHTFNVAMDIISRYDVDGLNFDYVRYNGQSWGYNPVAVQRFNRIYNRTGTPTTTDTAWLQFRRDQVTALVRKVYLHTMAIKPHVKISADTIAFAPGITSTAQWTGTDAYRHKMQDWRGWMEEGILDLNLPMMYFDHEVWGSAWTNWSIFTKNHRYNRHVALGMGNWFNTTSNSIVQIRSSRNTTSSGFSADGVSFYAYNGLSEDTSRTAFFNALVQPTAHDPISPPVFSTRVDSPVMPWKAAPTKGHLKGFVYDAATGLGLDYATVTLTGPVNKTLRTDATGFYGAVDLTPGTYTLAASNGGYIGASSTNTVAVGAVTSRDFSLQPTATPTIVSQPQSITVLVGSDAIFNVVATGNPAPAYQWRFNGTNISGATASSYTRFNVQPAHAGNYSVFITNSLGAVTSSNAVLAVTTSDLPPVITSYPQSQVAIAGEDVTLAATVQGTEPLSYQWRRNGVNISGATGNTYTITNAQTADAGNYTVHVSNSAGADSSLPALLTIRYTLTLAINGAGAISKNIDLPHYAPNSSVTLTASSQHVFAGWSGSATGTANPLVVSMNGNKVITATFTNMLIVESRRANGTLTPNPPYSDAGFADSTLKSTAPGLSGTGSRYGSSGTPTFTVRSTLPLAGGTYAVSMTHGSAASISDDITVSVTQSGCTGLPSSTTIFQESGANTWESLGTMTLSAGVTSPTLTFAFAGGTLGSSSRMYSDAIRFVSPAFSQSPVILMQPEGRTVAQGQAATFAVSASGTGTLSYQWRLNGSNISGATKSAYTRSNTQGSHAGNYSVLVSSTFGSATSSNALLTVIAPVTITTQPQSLTSNPDDDVTFSVSASGTMPIGYRWRYNGVDIPGATNSGHTVADAESGSEGNYSVVIYNALGGIASSNAVLTVRTPPEILNHPQEQTVNPGATVVFSVTASGTAPLSYQWQFNGTNIAATASSLTLNNAQPEQAGTYSVIVSNPAGAAVSDPASLIVRRPPVIVTQPSSQNVIAGTNVTFNVVATGSEPMSFQWRRNGTNLAEATQEELILMNVQPADAGSYSVVITNDLGTATSAMAELTVEAPGSVRIDLITILPDGRARLVGSGAPGEYGIEATTNLALWLELTNFTTSTNTFEFIDSETNLPRRFYRARTTAEE